MPARLLCLCASSHRCARLRTSPSSQMRAAVYGYSSASGWMEQYSVKTTPQPPSALVPRKAALAPGRSEPGPAQCAVWKNRFLAVLGPILTASKRMSYLESRAIAGVLLIAVVPAHANECVELERFSPAGPMPPHWPKAGCGIGHCGCAGVILILFVESASGGNRQHTQNL